MIELGVTRIGGPALRVLEGVPGHLFGSGGAVTTSVSPCRLRSLARLCLDLQGAPNGTQHSPHVASILSSKKRWGLAQHGLHTYLYGPDSNGPILARRLGVKRRPQHKQVEGGTTDPTCQASTAGARVFTTREPSTRSCTNPMDLRTVVFAPLSACVDRSPPD